jgi:hypothetical protein
MNAICWTRPDRNPLLAGYFVKAAPLVDAVAVSKTVARYAADIRCTNDNIVAAINYGLRVGGNTLDAIRNGKARARYLLATQPSGGAVA